MYRRALQNLILDKITDDPTISKKKLWEQIDELFKRGFITENLRQTAHEIRHFGNFGAHPTDDMLDDTTSEDPQSIDELSFAIINIVYIVPFKTEKMRERRNGK